MVPSPVKPVNVKARRNNNIEYEVDVRQLAESIRLLERKQSLTNALKTANDTAASELEASGEITASTRAQVDEIIQLLQEVGARLQIVLPPVHPQMHPQSPARFVTPRSMNPSYLDDHLTFSTPQSLTKPSKPFDTDVPRFDVFGVQYPRYDTPFRASLPLHVPTTSMQGRTNTPSSAPQMHGSSRAQSGTNTVDFRTAPGTAVLAKTITRAALTRMDPDTALKQANASVRADVSECVSACVAVLLRARATRDFTCIDELVDGLQLRFQQNAPALEAIRNAAKLFDTTSSDSQ